MEYSQKWRQTLHPHSGSIYPTKKPTNQSIQGHKASTKSHREGPLAKAGGERALGRFGRPTDEDITTSNTSTPTQNRVIVGPITRARARQLNQQVSSLLSSCSSYLDCGDTCTLLLIRNHGQDRKGEGLAQAGFGPQKNTNL
jgi:hypothetical protein